VVRYSMQGKSRTARSTTAWIPGQRFPQPEHTIRRLPRFRRTHNFNCLAFSSISLRYTR
jgi:hypothetical protein